MDDIRSAIQFNRPSVIGNELFYLQNAIANGQLSGDGEFTRLCSEQLIRQTNANSALLTHSCTAALEMAAILCNLQAGDEVIMPSFTFVSTANAVVLRGATPVFVDIDRNTLNIDPELVEKAVTKNSKAIFAVHYAGVPADMDALSSIAKKYDLYLIEDAAQALGSTYKGRLAGSLADMATFSFHETKNIISGEGGALTINRPELIERAEIIREKGTNRSNFIRGQVDKYTWVDLGSSFLPGELIAAFLYGQLEKANKIRHIRLRLFQRYSEALASFGRTDRIGLPPASNKTGGNGHMFYLLMRDLRDRTEFINYMRLNCITTPFHYIPLHSSPAGRRFGRNAGDLPVTDDVSDRLVRLPMFFSLEHDIERVIEKTSRYLEN